MNERNYNRSFLEKILSSTIMLLLMSMVLVPSGKKVLNMAEKTADKVTASNIYKVIEIGLVTDVIAPPTKDMYIVVENVEEITSSLDRDYRKETLTYLGNSMQMPDKTLYDKKKYIIKLDKDSNVSILTGSNLGDYIYPEQTGIYANN